MSKTYFTCISNGSWNTERLKTFTDSCCCVCCSSASFFDCNGSTYSVCPACIFETDRLDAFNLIVYGRTQSAFSEDGLAIGAGLEDLGKGLRSQVGTMYGTLAKGPRYLEMAEGYVTGIALDADDEIIGYQFVSLGKFTDFVKAGDTPNEAWEKAKGQYGRVADAVKIIDPRKE